MLCLGRTRVEWGDLRKLIRVNEMKRFFQKYFMVKGIDVVVQNTSLAETVVRAQVLCYIFAFSLFVYGFVSYPFISIYDPSISLWHNLWPRLLFNSVPMIFLGIFMRAKWLTPKTLLTIWGFAFWLIFLIACCIHAWEIALNIDNGILLSFDSSNQITFAVTIFFLLLPPSLLWRLYVASLVFFSIPAVIVSIMSGINPDSISFMSNSIGLPILAFAVAWPSGIILLKFKQREFEQSQTTSKLLRMVLHDLNNQLTILSLGVDRVEYIKTNSNINAFNKVRSSKDKIIEILDQVKKIEQSRSMRGGVKLGEISLGVALQELKNLFMDRLAHKGVSLEISHEIADDFVVGNHTILVNSILANFVSNAIKFSDPGGKVKIETKEEMGSIVILVKDQGRGMTGELIQKIFNQDAISSTIGTAGERGSGYGLMLAQSFVTLFGGKMTIYSPGNRFHERGNGTQVYIELLRPHSRIKHTPKNNSVFKNVI